MLRLHVDQFLAHFMEVFLFVAHFFFKPCVSFGGCLGFLHSTLHILHQFGQLAVFIIFFLESLLKLPALLLHLGDHGVALLEFLFDNLQLLWISESVF
mmetsp:Transcript_35475/g.43416  ORF Transcript_35475/g.43416 Transcript_35475/m.43416 type:complete len:98 (+) Transcript_35475:2777-3070(+)